MDLNCNSAPPAVKGQSVQSAGGKYVVCFYIPDADLESERHGRNTHTLYIDGTSIASGTTAEIISASSARPAGLSPVGNGGTFLETPPDGCTAFYFETNIPVMDNDDRSWTIHLTDDAGFSSASVTAYTKAPPVSAALTGESTITTADTTELEMSLEDYSGNVTCTWKSEDESIATVTADSSNSSKATVNPIAGGITTITVQAELADQCRHRDGNAGGERCERGGEHRAPARSLCAATGHHPSDRPQPAAAHRGQRAVAVPHGEEPLAE